MIIIERWRAAMTIEILQRLEDKIDNALETIELLRLQLEDVENKREKLIAENQVLQNKHASWEQNLVTMLEKLDSIEILDNNNMHEAADQAQFMQELTEA
jgi:cell division protein ZapB